MWSILHVTVTSLVAVVGKIIKNGLHMGFHTRGENYYKMVYYTLYLG